MPNMMKTKLMTAAVAAIVCTAPAFAEETFTIKDIRVEGLERVEPDTVFA